MGSALRAGAPLALGAPGRIPRALALGGAGMGRICGGAEALGVGAGAALATAAGAGSASMTGSGAEGVTAHQRPTARKRAPPSAGSQRGDFGSSGTGACAEETWAEPWLIFAQRFDLDGSPLSRTVRASVTARPQSKRQLRPVEVATILTIAGVFAPLGRERGLCFPRALCFPA